MTLEDLFSEFENAVADSSHYDDWRLSGYLMKYQRRNEYWLWKWCIICQRLMEYRDQSVDEWALLDPEGHTSPYVKIAIARAKLYIVARDKGMQQAILYKLASK